LVVAAVAACGDSNDDGSDHASSNAATSHGTTASQGDTTPTSNGTASNATSNGASTGTTTDASNATSGGTTAAMPTTEALNLTTADGKNLAATFTHPGTNTPVPGILLLHQFNADSSQWGDFDDTLVDAGFAVLALDLRGHGDSDDHDGMFTGLLSDPDQLPLDLEAGLEALAGAQGVDPARIATLGTSVGANLAVLAGVKGLGVRAMVSLSPRLSAIEALAGDAERMELGALFCVAGENDGGGAQADTCETLTMEASPGQLTILEGTVAHGRTIVDDFPEVREAIVLWLDMQLR
ncbi:MAG: alpha/beta fold hydrolase, partial [Myxococcota bacterium]